jgi:hypothetical protein
MTLKNKLELRKPIKIKELTAKDGWILTLFDCPQSNEYEIERKAPDNETPERIRFPKEHIDQMQLMPDEYSIVRNAIEEYLQERRQVPVYSNSLECLVGYDSLLRVMSKWFGNRVAYYRSEEGGSLSLEEARKEVYRKNINDKEAMELLDYVMRMPTEYISFRHLMELNDNSPRVAENVWEMVKREAQREFESGHRAAEAFEPADYMVDAWNRASYLGVRESFIAEWQPKGGIELSMIDGIAQAWIQLQFWTTESVKRAQTEPRRENHQFYEWKKWNKMANPKQWGEGHWDVPMISEKEAVEHAAQMADRWQRMYFRAIRNLRDWRRYTPQVTINNPQQVNIATDGGQQINLAKTEESSHKLMEKNR